MNTIGLSVRSGSGRCIRQTLTFKPGVNKEVYRADSAPDHRELPFFPDHEHSKPDRKGDVTAPSFLYGNPLLDLKRLRDVEAALRSK